LWGLNWSVIKVGLSFVNPATLVLNRFIVSTVSLVPIIVVLRKRIPKDSETFLKLLPYCLLYCSSFVATTFGLVEESSGIGALLTFTQPLFAFCLAIPFLEERITGTKLIGVAIGFLGVVIFFLGRINSFMLAPILSLTTGAFLWAASIVYYKKYLINVDLFVTSFFQFSIGVLPLGVLSLTVGGFVFSVEATYLWTLLYSSVGALVVASVIWLFLLKEEEATVLSGSSLITPVIALFFGWQLLGESINIQAILGATFIIGGVFLVNVKH
jgi:drug/metabolite transporter (DMT)-like permease